CCVPRPPTRCTFRGCAPPGRWPPGWICRSYSRWCRSAVTPPISSPRRAAWAALAPPAPLTPAAPPAPQRRAAACRSREDLLPAGTATHPHTAGRALRSHHTAEVPCRATPVRPQLAKQGRDDHPAIRTLLQGPPARRRNSRKNTGSSPAESALLVRCGLGGVDLARNPLGMSHRLGHRPGVPSGAPSGQDAASPCPLPTDCKTISPHEDRLQPCLASCFRLGMR